MSQSHCLKLFFIVVADLFQRDQLLVKELPVTVPRAGLVKVALF